MSKAKDLQKPGRMDDWKLDTSKPSIGRIVHYVLPGGSNRGAHRPAMITDASDLKINAVVTVEPSDVFQMSGGYTIGNLVSREFSLAHFVEGVRFDETAAEGTWHWPERV